MSTLTREREHVTVAPVLRALAPHFHIRQEVWGTHPHGKRLRIDAIVFPKDDSGWKRPDVALGIEFKRADNGRGGTTETTAWAAQCVDYALTYWDGFGLVYVFACPGLLHLDTIRAGWREPRPGSDAWTLPKVLAHLGVGELREHRGKGWSFVLQATHTIWSEHYGVQAGKNWTLERRFGAH